jgi:hypothetical protein
MNTQAIHRVSTKSNAAAWKCCAWST